ncbi:hypothetical protein JFU47_12295 [Pseudomonas sp. TH39(2020)]|uniref:hypothetical protein n=1 Tax=Pseudomonas sp. TH39(2020) TaxID=2796349 RepID=UPI001911272A|nr:hypothetical protein [Pseudomonas sp. TH39(2020)]MBK5397477.1 hypothetical protein [Pseudomonas sp. TH39(2020)]
MSVTTTLQNSINELNIELQEKLAKAFSESERITALLSNAVALHGIFLKFRPFQQELTTSGAWKIVTNGEDFAQSSVPSFLKVIEARVKGEAVFDESAQIMTTSDDDGPWDATREYLEQLWDNIKENWDNGREAIDQFEKDARDWYQDQVDWLDRVIDDL